MATWDEINAMPEVPKGVIVDGRFHCLGCMEHMDAKYAKTHPAFCYLGNKLMERELEWLLGP